MSPGSPRARFMRIARSMATQLIRREYVKSFWPPRVSQMPSSAWSQFSHSQSTMRRRLPHVSWKIGRAVLVVEVDGVDQLAVDVELALVGGARCRSAPAPESR